VLLQEGNQRWMNGQSKHPNVESARREATAREGQQPFATILSCADSRVPIEQLFDRGVGDLFVIRVAGNVVGDHQAGTIEYGSGHLKTPLLVVMGHTQCGAVAAAASQAHVEGHVAELVSSILPAVDRAKRQNPRVDGAALTQAAIRENVWQSIFDLLRTSPALRAQAREGSLMIVGAVYDIATGEVEFLGEHPWQHELVAALDARESSSASRPAGNATSADAARE
jgi:carbonic anhydrase